MGFQMTATETYDAETDVYRQFIDECLEEDPTGDGQIGATDPRSSVDGTKTDSTDTGHRLEPPSGRR